MGFLVGCDLVVVREGQRHVVEPFEETLFGKWIDIEVRRPSELVRDRLRGQVDSQFVSVMALDRGEHRINLFGIEDYRQESVL